MKLIEAIIRPGKMSDVLDGLNELKVYGVTATQVMGCGHQVGRTQYYRGAKYTLNLLPKIKLQIVAKESCVDDIVNAIVKASRTGEIGDGKIFICDVEGSVRIRTGDKGEAALV